MWTLTFTVGDEPIEELGGIRVQLPEAWHAGIRNSAFRVQATHPREPNYVTARSSRPDVVLQTFVELEYDGAIDKGGRWSNLSGRSGYYTYVTRAIVRHGSLAAGDTIEIVYGDTTGGSRGFRTGLHRMDPSPVLTAVDHRGTGWFRLHTARPLVTLAAGEPADLFVTARSDGVVGQPLALKIALIDEQANPAAGSEARLRLEVLEGRADLAATATLDPGRGWLEVVCTPRSSGVLRIQVFDDTRRLSARSNPVLVRDTAPARPVFWGDLHSHTDVSGDGIGTGAQAYEFARRVVGPRFLLADGSQLLLRGRHNAGRLRRIRPPRRRARRSGRVRLDPWVRSVVRAALRPSQRVLPRPAHPGRRLLFLDAARAVEGAARPRGAHDSASHDEDAGGRGLERRRRPGEAPQLRDLLGARAERGVRPLPSAGVRAEPLHQPEHDPANGHVGPARPGRTAFGCRRSPPATTIARTRDAAPRHRRGTRGRA